MKSSSLPTSLAILADLPAGRACILPVIGGIDGGSRGNTNAARRMASTSNGSIGRAGGQVVDRGDRRDSLARRRANRSLSPNAIALRTAMDSGLPRFRTWQCSTPKKAIHRCVVRTSQGRIRAERIVFATGYDSHRYLSRRAGSLHCTYATVSEPMRGFFWLAGEFARLGDGAALFLCPANGRWPRNDRRRGHAVFERPRARQSAWAKNDAAPASNSTGYSPQFCSSPLMPGRNFRRKQGWIGLYRPTLQSPESLFRHRLWRQRNHVQHDRREVDHRSLFRSAQRRRPNLPLRPAEPAAWRGNVVVSAFNAFLALSRTAGCSFPPASCRSSNASISPFPPAAISPAPRAFPPGRRPPQPSGLESRTMAWAIPRLLGAVPMHDAAHVSANGRDGVNLPVVIAQTGDSLAIELDHRPRAANALASRWIPREAMRSFR